MLRKNSRCRFKNRAISRCWLPASWRKITVTVAGMLTVILAGTALGQKALLVMENPGDLSQLVENKTIDEPENSFFAFQNKLSNVTGAKWQLSSNSSFLPLLGSGTFEPPAQGQGKIITVNWKNLVPTKPGAGTKYYFRVVSYQGRTVLLSNTVVITIKKSDSMTKFKPGMGVTVRVKNPELFAASPMPIEINLQKLRIDKSNEVHDEPYLLVAVVYLDGTTINPLAPQTSTVRIDPPRKVIKGLPDPFVSGPPRKTHGNVAHKDLNGDDLGLNKVAQISAAIGHFEASIKPIGLDLAADMEDPVGAIGDGISEGTAVFVVVVAMEQDNTSTETMDKAYDTMILELGNKVNGIVHGMTTQDFMKGTPPKFDPQKIAADLSGKLKAIVKDPTLTTAWFLPPIVFGKFPELDFDDYIGFAFERFSFGRILRAGKDGIDFAMTCENPHDYSGTYTVFGNIRRK
jgi:hypothetical protein